MSEVLIICLQNNKTKDDKPHNAFTVLSPLKIRNVNRSQQSNTEFCLH